MAIINKRKLGAKKNKLLRYKIIKELYNEAVRLHPHTPTTKILSEYIFPLHPISRTTLYEILTTPIASELKAIEDLEKGLIS